MPSLSETYEKILGYKNEVPLTESLVGKLLKPPPVPVREFILHRAIPQDVVKNFGARFVPGFEIPESYLRFLRFTNGCHLFYMSFCLLGVRGGLDELGLSLTAVDYPLCLGENQTRALRHFSENETVIGGYRSTYRTVAIDVLTGEVNLRPGDDGRLLLKRWESFDEFLHDEVNRMAAWYEANPFFVGASDVPPPA